MKNIVKKILRRLGLLRVAFRLSEAIKVVNVRTWYRNAQYSDKAVQDRLAIPPSKLIVLVAGTADISWYLESGKLAAQSILHTLEKHKLAIDHFQAILDFGCGCGRVIRHWNSLKKVKVYGTDQDPKLIKWCRLNLPFAQCETNDLYPPLSYSDGRFDFIYALSVFTHMPEPLQFLWINELSRVLRPGGYLLITTHGQRFLEELNPNEQEEYEAGRLVVRNEEAVGTNLCTACHPLSYVREKLAKGFDMIDFIPGGAKGNPHQDVFLLRKPV
ncbi:MAG: methylase involved in ubiquinone/menaquinone biosynthesis [candidate division NC10 bacterium]|nr:methylase involved in ubiquinone/menaquinone biosynthesis [candidate division NC10 bacterium]